MYLNLTHRSQKFLMMALPEIEKFSGTLSTYKQTPQLPLRSANCSLLVSNPDSCFSSSLVFLIILYMLSRMPKQFLSGRHSDEQNGRRSQIFFQINTLWRLILISSKCMLLKKRDSTDYRSI